MVEIILTSTTACVMLSQLRHLTHSPSRCLLRCIHQRTAQSLRGRCRVYQQSCKRTSLLMRTQGSHKMLFGRSWFLVMSQPTRVDRRTLTLFQTFREVSTSECS